jgi:hypothetical protein
VKAPLPCSYWVEPARLLAGEHPAGRDMAATRQRIDLLVAAGVRSFIDLTQAGEMPGYRELLPAGVAYANLSIPDHSIPASPGRMREILQALRTSMADGAVYVHCRAGIGRTSTTVGCWLRESGESPRLAIEKLNQLWQQNARAVHWPSVPETTEQQDYIMQWSVEAADAKAG